MEGNQLSLLPITNSDKKQNHIAILKEIRKQDMITKTDLVDKVHLTSVGVGNIVGELIEAGIVREAGYGESRGGRPPVLYTMEWDSVYVIAVVFGVKHISVSLVNLRGDIKENVTWDTESDTIIDRVFELIDYVLRNSSIKRGKILGIGVSAPGPIDDTNRVILTPPNLTGAKNLDIAQLLEERYQLATVLEVDANASALAEQWFGRVNPNEDILYVFNDQGLGGGLIIDSKIYKGYGNSAGEIGHMAIDIDGPACSCGNYGCLETLSSGIAIQHKVKAKIRRASPTTLTPYYENGKDNITLELIAEHANAGDSIAIQTFEEAARYLGIGVANVINLFAPDQVVFGGRVIELFPETIQIAEQVAKARSFSPLSKKIKFEQSSFNNHSSMVGAAATIQQKLFDHPETILM